MVARIFIILIILSFFSCTHPEKRKNKLNKKPLIEAVFYDSAAVVSGYPDASKIGLEILKQGGNAIDAMVAVHFALAVCYLPAGNIGGGGFMVFKENGGKVHTLDFRETAPAQAGPKMYINEKGEVIPDLSRIGHLSVGVPGAIRGMSEAHRKFGKLPWRDLIMPSILLAKQGYVLSEREANRLNKYLETKASINTVKPEFLEDHFPFKKGDVLKNPEFAEVLEKLSRNYGEGFYTGDVARLIVAEVERGGGLIDANDLRNYSPIWREPIIIQHENKTIYSMAPPSSGGILLGQLLYLYDKMSNGREKWHDKQHINLYSEACGLVYNGRAKYFGDPKSMEYHDELLNPEYLDSLVIGFEIGKRRIEHQEILPFEESEETTHFSIIDKDGNAVSVTTTLNGAFGSGVIVGGGGFFLNNEMDDFAAAPGVANSYGLIGDKNMVNGVGPGKRMLSSMTPTIVCENGKAIIIIGSPGGSTIITSVFQGLQNMFLFDMSITEAIKAKKIHYQKWPDSVYYELGAIEDTTLQALELTGYNFASRPPIGNTNAIHVRKDGRIEAVADPRGDNSSEGY